VGSQAFGSGNLPSWQYFLSHVLAVDADAGASRVVTASVLRFLRTWHNELRYRVVRPLVSLFRRDLSDAPPLIGCPPSRWRVVVAREPWKCG
jgi:hypothetical protein